MRCTRASVTGREEEVVNAEDAEKVIASNANRLAPIAVDRHWTNEALSAPY